jgi:putative heme-binding domain-containing protein
VIARHTDWATQLAGFFRTALSNDHTKTDLADRLAQFSHHPDIQQIMAQSLRSHHPSRTVVLDAMAHSDIEKLPDLWADELASLLADADSSDRLLASQVVKVVETFENPVEHADLKKQLSRIARDESCSPDIRLKALAASHSKDRLDRSALDLLLAHLHVDQPLSLRMSSVDALLKAAPAGPQLEALAGSLSGTGAAELNLLLPLFQTADSRVGRQLVSSLSRCAAVDAADPEQLAGIFAQWDSQGIASDAAALLARIRLAQSEQREKIGEICNQMQEGDVRRGLRVFKSSKAACASCHSIGYVGGDIGPDLTHIGRIRTARDLAEAILFPNASFVRSYEPAVIATKAGEVFSGIVHDESKEELTLILDADKVVKIPITSIEERQPGTVSVMPSGLDKNLTHQELIDLIAFLSAAK